jgi:hypothetical protein
MGCAGLSELWADSVTFRGVWCGREWFEVRVAAHACRVTYAPSCTVLLPLPLLRLLSSRPHDCLACVVAGAP